MSSPPGYQLTVDDIHNFERQCLKLAEERVKSGYEHLLAERDYLIQNLLQEKKELVSKI